MTDKIIQRLAENFGLDRVREPEALPGEHFAIGPEWRLPTAFPANLDELSEMIQMASLETGRSFRLAGYLARNGQCTASDLIISTTHMNRVLEYEPQT
jgi:hypothetical protein